MKTLAAIILAGIATVALAQVGSMTCFTTGTMQTCTWYMKDWTYCTMTCFTTGTMQTCTTTPSQCNR
jgi:hypothetical protein